MKKAAIGFRVHSGWAALVAVSLEKDMPVVLSRRRVHLVKVFNYSFRQPYHTAREMGPIEGESFVSQVRQEAEDLARMELAATREDLQKRGYEVDRGGLLLASARPLPELKKILLSHALIHTADGELFRDALNSASSRCKIRLLRICERELLEACGKMCSRKPAQLLKQVTAHGKGIGAPWSQDEKFATLAAWLSLSRRLPKS